MSVTCAEFFADPAVSAALDRYAAAALDHLEAQGAEVELPDARAYLEEQGISEIPDGPIEVHRTVGDPEHVMRLSVPTARTAACRSAGWSMANGSASGSAVVRKEEEEQAWAATSAPIRRLRYRALRSHFRPVALLSRRTR